MGKDFKTYYEHTLLPRLTELDADRIIIIGKLKKSMLIILSGTFGIGLLFYLVAGLPAGFIAPGIALVLGLIGYAIHYYKLTKPYSHDFKEKIIKVIIKYINENLEYDPYAKISPEQYKESGIFRKSYDRYNGEDLIYGTLEKTKISFSELHTEYKTTTTDSKGRQQTTWHTIFKGVFLIADFNKNFQSYVYVLPDTAERMFGKWGQKLQSLNKTFGNLVKLEDPEFEKEFAVYGSDQVEARYLLSTSLMQRILDFKRKSGRRIHLSFVNSKLNLAISLYKNLFEAKIFRTIVDYDYIKSNLDYLILFTGIVDDLNLNQRIWSKQ